MAKKNFGRGIDAILGGPRDVLDDEIEKTPTKAGALPKIKAPAASERKVEAEIEDKDEIEAKAKKPESKICLVLDDDLYHKAKALAFWERKANRYVLEEAIDLLLQKHGEEYVKRALKAFKDK